MELDDLKTIWKEQDLLSGTGHEPAGQLARLLRERSRGPIERMRHNLRIESLLLILTYIPTIIGYLTMFHGSLWIIAVVFSLILIFYGVYFYMKSRLLKKMQCVTCEVRSNLARQVRVLGKYLRLYLWSGTLLLLIALVIAYEVLKYTRDQVSHRVTPYWWIPPVFLLVLLGLFAVGSYFLNRWYANKLYGRHIKKLKELLREMDEV
ncbi:MAG TPA: hypothetical protein VG605_20750 [Puia sp.]|nr:hypothetical protein [Puia sp.]